MDAEKRWSWDCGNCMRSRTRKKREKEKKKMMKKTEV